jgi:predicted transcriptional regulator
VEIKVRAPADIGAAVMKKREADGMDRTLLAEKAGVSARQILRLELYGKAADPKLSTIRAVAGVLGLTFVIEPGRPEVKPHA